MIYLYRAESIAPSGKLIRKFVKDPEKAKRLTGRLTRRRIKNRYGGRNND